MGERVYLYPIWVRLWHVSNAILCLTLLVTGMSLQYSEPGSGLVPFKAAVSIHNFCGTILSISYIFYFLGNIFTRNGRHYRLEPIGLIKRLWKQFYFYSIGFFKKDKPPFPIGKTLKFNPLQKVAYAFVMYIFMPILILTGWAMMFPEIIVEEYLGLNTFIITDLLHTLGAFVLSIFLIIHLYF
jgi:thiosulfate reductase cytochrome b subunit